MSDTRKDENPIPPSDDAAPADASSTAETPSDDVAPADGKDSGGKGKPKKIKKAPGFFKKELAEKRLEKKYLKYLEQSGDKAFVRSCYVSGGGLSTLRQDLDAKEVKRLKLLAKAIKANRKSAVKFLPLAAVAVLVAAAVGFFALFANPLLQRALERGLEAIFEARVEAVNFRASLFKFEAVLDGLAIADRDQPMKNLLEFGAMRIKLKPAAVLRGKIYIEEIRADRIRFATDRTVSGALPDKPPKESPPKEDVSVPPLVDLRNFDPMALLDQEYEKLQTPKLYDTAMEAYETAVAKWKGEEAAARARLEELRARAEPLLRINVNDYRTLDAATIERIRTVVSEVNALVATVQAAQADVERMVSGVQGDFNTAVALEQSARNAVAADFDHLRSYLDLGSGAAQEVLEPVIGSILTDAAKTYVSYGERALEILEKVKALQAKLPKSAPKPPRAERYRGRDVVFPVRQYPRFFMGVVATDVLTPQDWLWSLDLRGVSSDPDLSDLPTSLELALSEDGEGLARTAAFNGMADFRSGARERFNATVSGGGFPVNVSSGLDKIGVGGFSGGASFTLNAAGNVDGGFLGSGEISLVQAKLANPSNTFAQAADEAIRKVDSVNLGVRYEHNVSGRDRFALTTNFADILKDALGRIVAQFRAKAEAELERALRAKIEQYIDGKFVSKEELDLVFRAVRGDKSAVDDLKGTLDRKKAELEGKIEAAAKEAVDELKRQGQEAVDQAKEEAREQGRQAVEDVLQGKTPSPTLPSLPSAPSLPGLPGGSGLRNPFGSR